MKRKTLTILFADVQGYTSRTSRQTRKENELFVTELKSFIEKNAGEKGGILVKTMGDGFLLTFESPTDAIICGQNIQSQIEQRNSNVLNNENFIRFRIGISTGEVNLDESGDVYGDAVNIAARIQSFAEPNGVYISESTYLAMNRSEINALDLGPQQFKNVMEEVRVYKVVKGNVAAAFRARKRSKFPKALLVSGLVFFGIIFLMSIASRVKNRSRGSAVKARSAERKNKAKLNRLSEKEDYSEVIRTGENLLQKNPSNMNVRKKVINSYIKAKDFEGAKRHVKEALEAAPGKYSILSDTADMMSQEGYNQAAAAVLKEYVKLEPVRYKKNKALRKINKLEKKSQDKSQPQQSYIMDLINQGKYEEVIDIASKQLEENPDNGYINELLGSAYLLNADYDKAETYLKRAIEILPRRAISYQRLAYVYEQKGDYGAAIQMYEE
jgi:class 3 adenylate cyclase/Flp pilus assembly protein TadD